MYHRALLFHKFFSFMQCENNLIKIHSLKKALVYFFIVNVLMLLLIQYVTQGYVSYSKEFLETKTSLISLKTIKTKEELDKAKLVLDENEYLFYNVPLNATPIKDPLNHLSDNKYIFIDYKEEVGKRITLFSARKLGIKPIYINLWEKNKWTDPVDPKRTFTLFDDFKVTFDKDNYINLEPLTLNKTNFKQVSKFDHTYNSYLYTQGEFNDLREQIYVLKPNTKITFRAKIKDNVVTPIPLFKDNPKIYYYVNKDDVNLKQDIQSMAHYHLMNISFLYFPNNIIHIILVFIVTWLVLLYYGASFSLLVKALAERLINREISSWFKDKKD